MKIKRKTFIKIISFFRGSVKPFYIFCMICTIKIVTTYKKKRYVCCQCVPFSHKVMKEF